MISTIQCFTAACDRCGCDFPERDAPTLFLSEEIAIGMLSYSGWSVDGTLQCFDCLQSDELEDIAEQGSAGD